MKLSEI